MRWARGWTALRWVALVWLAAGLPSVAVAQPRPPAAATAAEEPCTELARYAIHGSARELVVPVSVQLMKYRGKKFPANDIAGVFSEPQIKRLLRPSGTVGTIWAQAKIRLALYRLRLCEYTREDFHLQPTDREEIPSPDAGEAGATFFRRVNERYNDRTLRGLDVYLWWDMRAWAGYGARHRDDRPGAVWLDRDCRSPSFDGGCDRLLAHEIGHFFGLCHSCKASWDPTDPVTCRVCIPDGQEPPICGRSKDFIMRSTYDGKRLTTCEIAEATRRARERTLPAAHN